MKKYSGDATYPIWLLGDSNPKNWQSHLDTPLDPRHPARHNIWTPILDVIQDVVFRTERVRVDTTKFFVQNAIEKPEEKPTRISREWSHLVVQELEIFRVLLVHKKPKLILSFGAFAFEFARRALGETPVAYDDWRAATLGRQFQERLKSFNPADINLLPLLHVSISRGRFISSHNYFCAAEGANYFDMVGQAIGRKFVEYRTALPIWIE